MSKKSQNKSKNQKAKVIILDHNYGGGNRLSHRVEVIAWPNLPPLTKFTNPPVEYVQQANAEDGQHANGAKPKSGRVAKDLLVSYLYEHDYQNYFHLQVGKHLPLQEKHMGQATNYLKTSSANQKKAFSKMIEKLIQMSTFANEVATRQGIPTQQQATIDSEEVKKPNRKKQESDSDDSEEEQVATFKRTKKKRKKKQDSDSDDSEEEEVANHRSRPKKKKEEVKVKMFTEELADTVVPLDCDYFPVLPDVINYPMPSYKQGRAVEENFRIELRAGFNGILIQMWVNRIKRFNGNLSRIDDASWDLQQQTQVISVIISVVIEQLHVVTAGLEVKLDEQAAKIGRLNVVIADQQERLDAQAAEKERSRVVIADLQERLDTQAEEKERLHVIIADLQEKLNAQAALAAVATSGTTGTPASINQPPQNTANSMTKSRRDKKNTSRIIIDKIDLSNESSSVVYSQEQQQQLDGDDSDNDQDREHNDEFGEIDQDSCEEEENEDQLEDDLPLHDSNQPSGDDDEQSQWSESEAPSNHDLEEFEKLDSEKLVAVKVTQSMNQKTQQQSADDISSSSEHKRRRILETPVSSPDIQNRPLVSFVESTRDVNMGEKDDDETQQLLIRRSTRPLSTRPVNYFPDYENGSLLTETTSESRHKTMSQYVEDKASRTEAMVSPYSLPVLHVGKRADGESAEQQQKQQVKQVTSKSPPKLSEERGESEDLVKQEPSVSVVASSEVFPESSEQLSPLSSSSTSEEFEQARQLVEERLRVKRVKQAKAKAEIQKMEEEMKKLEAQRQSCATELTESHQLTKAQLNRLKVQIDNIQAEMKRVREEYDQKKANLEKKMNLYGNLVETLAIELDDAKETFKSGQDYCIRMESIVENYHKIV